MSEQFSQAAAVPLRCFCASSKKTPLPLGRCSLLPGCIAGFQAPHMPPHQALLLDITLTALRTFVGTCPNLGDRLVLYR